MSRKIIGSTVGTGMKPQAMIEKTEQAKQIEDNTKDLAEVKTSLNGKEASGTAEAKVSAHNTSIGAHEDIRTLIRELTSRLNSLADSDDTTLDQLSEIVAYIKSNKSLIDSVTTSKANASDLTAHTGNKNNPHGVTASQVGALTLNDLPKTVITTDATSGAKTLTLTSANSNNEWRYVYASGITSLKLASSGSFVNTAEAYYGVTFLSGTTATTLTNTLGAYFTGDDCVDGVFTPIANKTYELGIWWNGLAWQAVVRGV